MTLIDSVSARRVRLSALRSVASPFVLGLGLGLSGFVYSAPAKAQAVIADNTSRIIGGDYATTRSGVSGYGIEAINGGIVTDSAAVTITGTGTNVIGIDVKNGGKVTLANDLVIRLPGTVNGNGINVVDAQSAFTANGKVTISLTDTGGNNIGAAFYVTSGATVNLNGGGSITNTSGTGLTVYNNATFTATDLDIDTTSATANNRTISVGTNGTVTLNGGGVTGRGAGNTIDVLTTGKLNLTGTQVSTGNRGSGSSIKVANAAIANLDNVIINTDAVNGEGLLVTAGGSVTTKNGLDITILGNGSHGVWLNGGTMTGSGPVTIKSTAAPTSVVGLEIQDGAKFQLDGQLNISTTGAVAGNAILAHGAGAELTVNDAVNIEITSSTSNNIGDAVRAYGGAAVNFNGGGKIWSSFSQAVTVNSEASFTGRNLTVTSYDTTNSARTIAAATGGQVSLTDSTIIGAGFAPTIEAFSSGTKISLTNSTIETGTRVSGAPGAGYSLNLYDNAVADLDGVAINNASIDGAGIVAYGNAAITANNNLKVAVSGRGSEGIYLSNASLTNNGAVTVLPTGDMAMGIDIISGGRFAGSGSVTVDGTTSSASNVLGLNIASGGQMTTGDLTVRMTGIGAGQGIEVADAGSSLVVNGAADFAVTSGPINNIGATMRVVSGAEAHLNGGGLITNASNNDAVDVYNTAKFYASNVNIAVANGFGLSVGTGGFGQMTGDGSATIEANGTRNAVRAFGAGSAVEISGYAISTGTTGAADTVSVRDAATFKLDNATVTAQADNAGALAVAQGGNGVATNTSFTTHGAVAPAVWLTDGGDVTMNGGALTTNGTGSFGILSDVAGNASALNRFSGNGVTIKAADAAIAVRDGLADVSLTGSTVSSGTDLVFDVAMNAKATLSADRSTMTGAMKTETGSVADVTLTNGTLWKMTGNSNVSSLANDASRIQFDAQGAFKTLTTDSYTGHGGTIGLNSFLGGDGSPSDLLVINGGTATGRTFLEISQKGGNGALIAGNGIMVVQAVNGATTDAGAFMLGGRVAAGAYEYQLYQNGVGTDAADQNWYLRNTYIPAPTPDNPNPQPVALVRPEVPVSVAVPSLAIEYGYAMLGTLHERVGETTVHSSGPVTEERVVHCKDASQNFRCVVRVPLANANGSAKDETRWASSGWARLMGDRGQHRPDNFATRGPNYDYTFGGLQAGLDLYAHEQADGTLDKAGIYVGYGQISSNVKGQFGGKAGTVDMDAYTVGGYWTHHGASGWYTDAVIQGTWYSADAKSVYGQRIKPDGFGILASLEGGYSFKLGNGFTIEPQAQVIYQNVSFGNANDAYGLVHFDDGDSLRGRLGVRVTKSWNMADEANPRLVTAWLRANVWHEFMGTTTTSVGSLNGQNMTPFNSYLDGTWGELGAGVTAQVSDKVSLFATGAYNRSLDNKGRDGWDGRLGMTIKW